MKNEWIDASHPNIQYEPGVSGNKNLSSSVVSESKTSYLKFSLSGCPLSSALLFNITVTLSVPNRKMALAPPEEFKARPPQDFGALLLTDEVTQPE